MGTSFHSVLPFPTLTVRVEVSHRVESNSGRSSLEGVTQKGLKVFRISVIHERLQTEFRENDVTKKAVVRGKGRNPELLNVRRV